MVVELGTPTHDGSGAVVRALRDWQRDEAPLQLHPGDLGWYARLGARACAASLRTWHRDGDLVAVGLLDGADVLRLTVAPEAWHDEHVGLAVRADLSDPGRGVLPDGEVSVEVPDGALLRELLSEEPWARGEPWTPLRRDLGSDPDPAGDDRGLRVEVVASAAQVAECVAVHRSAWDSDRFGEEGWHAMASGPAFADARCLLARDDRGTAVGAVTVWSAGPGRPGLLEPLGVHADHRGRGHGAALCRAAAGLLRELGCSAALVCTPTSWSGAIRTYEAAGYVRLPERFDRTRVR